MPDGATSINMSFNYGCAGDRVVTTRTQSVLALGEQLRQRGWTISCAESCTGGGLAYAFTSVSGSSDWFNVSWVTYSNDAKHQQLGVLKQTLTQYGAVSEQTVIEMAQGVAANSGAQVAVSVSGIAGPGGGSAEKPVGTVWFGFSFNGNTSAAKMLFSGDREAVREQAIDYVLARCNDFLA